MVYGVAYLLGGVAASYLQKRMALARQINIGLGLLLVAGVLLTLIIIFEAITTLTLLIPMLISALAAYEGTMLFVSHDRHFLAALSNRVLELTPEGIHDFAGGYTEYVARTGQEAPGLRS